MYSLTWVPGFQSLDAAALRPAGACEEPMDYEEFRVPVLDHAVFVRTRSNVIEGCGFEIAEFVTVAQVVQTCAVS